MRKRGMLTPKFKALCHELLKLVHPSEVVLVGSAVLAVRKLRDVNDLDVITWGSVVDRLVSKGQPTARDGSRLEFRTEHGVIQLTDHFWGFAANCDLPVVEIMEKAELWNSSISAGVEMFMLPEGAPPEVSDKTSIAWRIFCMDHFIQFKRACNREKDFADLRLLKGEGYV